MKKPASKRRPVKLTPRQMTQLRKDRELIAGELPSLMTKQKRLREAANEQSEDGALRRTIHASKILLHDLARLAGTNLKTLDAFLTGNRALPSAVADRLSRVLKRTVARVNGSPLHQEETQWNGAVVFAEGHGLAPDDPEFKRRERRGPNAPSRASKKRSSKQPKQ
jgi:hypothetical protein